jgi:hypothetical protein
MNTKICIPVILVSLLTGCAATEDLAHNDATRVRVLAELEQAKADGLVPITESQYMYPWPGASTRTANATHRTASEDAGSAASRDKPAGAASTPVLKSDS